MAELKICSLFATGKTCKNGQECKFLHSEEQREDYINKERIKARSRLRYGQKVDVISTAELTDPQFGILVSGFGGVFEEGSPKVSDFALVFHSQIERILTHKSGHQVLQDVHSW